MGKTNASIDKHTETMRNELVVERVHTTTATTEGGDASLWIHGYDGGKKTFSWKVRGRRRVHGKGRRGMGRKTTTKTMFELERESGMEGDQYTATYPSTVAFDVTAEAMEREIKWLIAHYSRVHLRGHSMGGLLIANVWSKLSEPERAQIGSVVMYDVPFEGVNPKSVSKLIRNAHLIGMGTMVAGGVLTSGAVVPLLGWGIAAAAIIWGARKRKAARAARETGILNVLDNAFAMAELQSTLTDMAKHPATVLVWAPVEDSTFCLNTAPPEGAITLPFEKSRLGSAISHVSMFKASTADHNRTILESTLLPSYSDLAPSTLLSTAPIETKQQTEIVPPDYHTLVALQPATTT